MSLFVSETYLVRSTRRGQMPVSLRPFGARSSHWYMPHRPSNPRLDMSDMSQVREHAANHPLTRRASPHNEALASRDWK